MAIQKTETRLARVNEQRMKVMMTVAWCLPLFLGGGVILGFELRSLRFLGRRSTT